MNFCTKCGKQLQDNEVCSCSTQNVMSYQPEQQNQNTYYSDNSQPVFNTNNMEQPVNGSSKNAFFLLIPVVILVALVVALMSTLMGGGYKKPLKQICNVVNKQEKDVNKLAKALLPDFASDAFIDLLSLSEDSDEVSDSIDEVETGLEELYESLEDALGDDVKVTYEIKDKQKMDKDDLEDIEDSLHDLYESYLEDIVDEIDDMDSDDWEDMADELDISKSDAKKLGKVVKDFSKELEKAKVSSGYELEVKIKIEGDDTSLSETFEFNVIKINGEWMIDYFTLAEEYSSYLYNYMY